MNSTLKAIQKIKEMMEHSIEQHEQQIKTMQAMAAEAGDHGRWLEERIKSISSL